MFSTTYHDNRQFGVRKIVVIKKDAVYLCLFFRSENVWDFAKVEDVVDVL